MLQHTETHSLSYLPAYGKSNTPRVCSLQASLKEYLGLSTEEQCFNLIRSINDDWAEMSYIMPPPLFQRLSKALSIDPHLLLYKINTTLADRPDKYIKNVLISLPDECSKMHQNWLIRTLEAIRGPGYKEASFDMLAKDRAVISGQMACLGSRLADISRPFPRRLLKNLIRSHPRLLLSSALKNFKIKGLELHLEQRALEHFNQSEFKEMLRMLKEIIKINDGIDLAFGSSWFYSPEMDRVSPYLSYMRESILEQGGSCFPSGSRSEDYALASSRTRRRAYIQGEYTPDSYTFVIH